MNCLVTGVDGFIGKHLARFLTESGHNVFGADLKRGMDILSPLPGNWDYIFHLAAVSRTPAALANPLGCFTANVMGSINVLEMARARQARRVVMASSNVVYAANTPYRASKLAMEQATEAYRDSYGASVVCLRFSNVTGAGYPKGDMACVAAMRDSFIERGFVEITGDGEQSRDFSHVNDICRALLLAAESSYLGPPLDICTGRNITMNRVVDLMAEALGERIERRYVPDRPGDCKHIYQDPERAVEAIGYCATRFGEEAIREVAEECRVLLTSPK